MTEEEFKIELKRININISKDQIEKLNKYQELLKKKNEVMNLTGIVEKNEVFLKHFYDSLTLFKIIDLTKIETFCDIGTGAGFPGLVIKILFPNLKVTLVDSLNKRIKFLDEVIEELELKDIKTIHARAEEFSAKNKEKYDVVTARAVASLNVLLEISAQAVKKEGYFIAMKAKLNNEYDKSLNAASKLGFKPHNKIIFELPKEKSTRSLVSYIKKTKTIKLFPRKFSEIKKKPL